MLLDVRENDTPTSARRAMWLWRGLLTALGLSAGLFLRWAALQIAYENRQRGFQSGGESHEDIEPRIVPTSFDPRDVRPVEIRPFGQCLLRQFQLYAAITHADAERGPKIGGHRPAS